jgi:integrase
MKTLLQSTKSEQLFPRYCDGVTANADNASAAVNKYIRALGIKARTAHCARHAMRDLLRHANVTIDVMNEIGGWGSQSIADRYGEGHDLKTKTEAITRALAPVLDTL